jgi:hypothetical protein
MSAVHRAVPGWGVRIGLDLGRAADGHPVVRAVGVRRGRIVWHVDSVLAMDPPLERSLTDFLTHLPAVHTWPRHRIAVALGPTYVQLKRLPGLPPLADPRQLTAVVRENAARFFLRNGVPLVTSRLRLDAPGDAWGAATELPVLAAVEAACRAARLRLLTIVPTAAVLAAATGARRAANGAVSDRAVIAWEDGDRRVAFTYAGDRLVAAIRLCAGAASLSSATPVVPDLPNGSACYAGAYGIATKWMDEPIAWRPSRAGAAAPSRRSWVRAWAALTVALVGALLAPGWSASLTARRAAAHLRATAHQRRAALATADSLGRVTGALAQAASFEVARRPATFALADLTQALPPSSAIVSLQLDTVGGTLVALAPDAADLVARLARVPWAVDVEIVGPVTRESVSAAATIGGPIPAPRAIERVTVRFRSGEAHP